MSSGKLIIENRGNIFKGDIIFQENSKDTYGMVGMSLQELELKQAYDSGEDDIVEKFYIPVLSQSVLYRRLAGFFSSTALSIAARGLANFIANDGHMELVVGAKLHKADIEAIKEGTESPEKVIEKMMLDDLQSIENEFVRDHVRALAWMVANKRLEIKVAVMTDDKGLPLDEYTINDSGIFHMKVGILMDKEGNTLSFSGSVNESATAWQRNIEEFKVFRSWINGEVEHLKSDIKKFEKYWFGNGKNVKILDIPNAVRQKLIQIAPANIDELKNLKYDSVREPRLRPYQNDAIENWLKNGKKGMFEMATGTGKTYTALGCVKELHKVCKKLVVVIICPYQHLVTQWLQRDIAQFGYQGIVAFGNSNIWSQNLTSSVLDLNNDHIKLLIIGTTYDTFCSDRFINIINKIDGEIFLIADEVHNAGAPITRRGLIDKYTYKLGLSATPRRWFDDEGTDMIYNYFGDTVFEFTLKQAITTINPDTNETYLAPYEYHPFFVELTNRELSQYYDMCKEITVQYFKSKNNENKRKLFELLCIQRQDIVRNAYNKSKKFEEILDSLDNVNDCLVYCSPQQIDRVQEILNRHGIVQSRFTGEEDDNKRQELLRNFAERKYQALVAMKCLDEGVDVPSTRVAIFLASSGNPKEFIQRRGRILRRFPRKEKAIIYDIIVVPTLSPENIDSNIFQMERKILQKELKRYGEFAESSMNYAHTLNKVFPIKKLYNIDW